MLFSGLLLLALAVGLDGRVRPLITTAFTYQAKLYATRAVNDAVLAVVGEGDVRYGSIIRARENEEGRVTFLETDMAAMNRLKSEITNEVADRLQRAAEEEVALPLGTLLGGNFLSGRGPSVRFRVMPAGYAETDFYNDFRSAGINQTLHQLMISVQVPVSAMMPLYTVTTDVTTTVCVAETVIVGDVPESFTDISGDGRGLLDKAGDYVLRDGK